MRTRTKVVLSIGLTIAVMAALVGAVYVYTDWGNDQIRQSVEESFSRGDYQLRVGKVGSFKLFSPVGVVWGTAEDVRVVGPDDREVFAVGEVTTALDIGALFGRTLHFREARISGAELPVDRNTGYPKIGVPQGRRKVFEPRSMDVQLDNVELGLYLVDTAPTGEKVIVGRLHGELAATIPADMPGVRMKLRKAKGAIAQPEAIQLLDASGEVDTNAETVADIRFSAITRGTAVTGSLAYVPSDPEHPLQPTIENVRDAGILNNPMDALNGMGLDIPMDALKKFVPAP